MTRRFTLSVCSVILVITAAVMAGPVQSGATHADLVSLFDGFLDLDVPPTREGAPDYSRPSIARRRAQLKTLQSRLAAIDPGKWPIEQQIDYAVVRAEVNAQDFDLRVLRPWERDPAFYKSIWTGQSDTPAHEGPTHHAVLELWTYSFPLSPADESRMTAQLRSIPPLLRQAQTNLVGNARDLWVTGAGTMRAQVADLAALDTRVAGGEELKKAIAAAAAATAAFADWLDKQASSKTGPSGIGKAEYTWNLQNVHLVPMTWEDEVALLSASWRARTRRWRWKSTATAGCRS